MTTNNIPFETDVAPTYERLVRLTHLTRDMPADVRELVTEVVEAATISLDELQVVVEELRQQNEELLAARREVETQHRRYRDLFEFAPDGYLVTDPSGVIQDANQAAAELLTVSRGELVGKPLVVYVASGDRDRFRRQLEKLTRGHKAKLAMHEWEIAIRPRHKDTFSAALTAAPVLDAEGQLTGLRWLLRDITATKRAQERERLLAEVSEQHELAVKANRLLEALIDTMPIGVMIVDTGGNIQSTNAAGRQILRESVTGTLAEPQRSFTSHHLDGTPIQANEGLLERALRRGETSCDVEALIRWPGKEDVILLSNAAPVRDKTGEIVGAVSVFQDITDRKRMMNELDAERARLKAVIENVPAGIIVSNMKAEISLINPTFEALYKRAVADSNNGLKFCRADGTPYTAEEMPFARSAITGEVIAGEEMAILWADGTQTDLLVNSAPISEEVIGEQTAVGTFQDITEIKQVQRALQLYADRLRVLNTASRTILASESVDEIVNTVLPFMSQLVYWQRASVLAFDREKGEALILGVHALKGTVLGQGVRFPLPQAWLLEELSKGNIAGVGLKQTLDSEDELVQKLHTEGVHFLVLVPLLAHNELLGALSMGFKEPTNLTLENQEIARQLADGLAIGIWQARLQEQLQQHAAHLEQLVTRRTAALRDSEARFRTIFEASVVGIVLLNNKGQVVTSNPAFDDMLSRSQDELLNTRLTDYMHPEDAGESKRLFRSLAHGKLDNYLAETRYIHKDGSQRWCELTVCRIKGAGQNRHGYAIAMAKDITQRKLNQEVLIRSERLSIAGRLGASLAHEINNPLQSVIGCLGLAEETLGGNVGDEALRYLTIAMDELDRTASIVAQLRDLGRSPEATKESTDLNELIEKALVLVRKRAQEQRVEVEWTPAPKLPPIPLVAGRIQQVFLNLLLNAIEAMPDGGRLQVQTAPTTRPTGVRILFADTGVGIEPGKLKQLFEPFQSNRPGGLGLGLYISSSIVNDHGGFIEVDSHVGEGTTLTVWLPR